MDENLHTEEEVIPTPDEGEENEPVTPPVEEPDIPTPDDPTPDEPNVPDPSPEEPDHSVVVPSEKKPSFPRSRALFGRRVITTDADVIDRENVVEELGKAFLIHQMNSLEIDYLYWYRRGKQPILGRVKEIRPEICNMVVENHAEEIVTFKDGYLLGEPLQYVGAAKDETVTDKIITLNRWMKAESKAPKDLELAEWFHTAGTAYRFILPRRPATPNTAPFEFWTLDPRYTFVVYYNGLGKAPKMGVQYVAQEDGNLVFSVYTDKWYFEIVNNEITRAVPHILGDIPIVEYPANSSRLGSFEIVLPILDAMNNMESNRMDGIEQFIQALMKFVNADISESDFVRLSQLGAIKIKSEPGQEADVEYMSQELNQTQSQVTKDDLYSSMLYICGMPNRNGGSSTSDTGAAVIMRDGWSDAEARAKKEEAIFKKSEAVFLRLALRYADIFTGLGLDVADVDTKFTRRNYENIQMKSQVLTTMLDNPKIHPQLAFIHCGLFVDAESAYEMSMQYQKEQEAKAQAIAEAQAKAAGAAGGKEDDTDDPPGEE